MTGLLSEIFLYKGSEVDNNFANYLIDEIYRGKKLFLINVELKKEDNKVLTKEMLKEPQSNMHLGN